MTAHIFTIATFPESSEAYEALSELRQAAGAGRILFPQRHFYCA